MKKDKEDKGKFVTLEGIEGVGKTTVIEYIANLLNEKNIQFIQTCEPGGTKFGNEIRNILLEKNDYDISGNTELLLLTASRLEHINTIIKPALETKWVLCDRYVDATYAYQGYGRGIELEMIDNTMHAINAPMPDLTLLLDADVKTALTRAKERSEPDRFESESVEFFNKVRNGYLDRKQNEPNRIKIVDSNKNLESVMKSVKKIIIEFIESDE